MFAIPTVAQLKHAIRGAQSGAPPVGGQRGGAAGAALAGTRAASLRRPHLPTSTDPAARGPLVPSVPAVWTALTWSSASLARRV